MILMQAPLLPAKSIFFCRKWPATVKAKGCIVAATACINKEMMAVPDARPYKSMEKARMLMEIDLVPEEMTGVPVSMTCISPAKTTAVTRRGRVSGVKCPIVKATDPVPQEKCISPQKYALFRRKSRKSLLRSTLHS